MGRRKTFFGCVSWSDKSVEIEDRISLEKISAELPDAVLDAHTMDDCAFILTDKQLYRLDESDLRLYVLSLEDILSGWALSPLQCIRSDVPAAEGRLSHFGLCRLSRKESAVTTCTDRLRALLACTDESAFLAVNGGDSTRLFKVYDADSWTDDGCPPVLLQLGLADSVCVQQMVCGKAHVVLLDSRGRVLTFGIGSRGELGHGAVASEQQPKVVDALADVRIVAIAAGGWHSAAVTDDGDVYLWGWNDSGQLGVDNGEVGTSSLPLPLDLPEGILIRKVACGSRHTLLLSDDRIAFGCGINDYGQVGQTTIPAFLVLYCLGQNVCDIDAAGWTSNLYE
uniref:Uncharacterized protein n=1 Tax=Plectus sambesii TaxID=2011161 RepID=A0A914WR58_9BILA